MSTTTSAQPEMHPPLPNRHQSTGLSRAAPAISGFVGAALGLGASEVIHRIAGNSVPAPVIAIGDTVIDLTPGSAVRTGISTLGTADKPALVIGIVVVTLLIGAKIGSRARSARSVGLAFVALAAVGAWASLRQPENSLIGVLAGATAVAGVAAATCYALQASAQRTVAVNGSDFGEPTQSTRRFVLLAGSGAALGALLPFLSRRRGSVQAVDLARSTGAVSTTAAPAGALDGTLAGLSPYFTPNKAFYRIDTSLSAPRVTASDWELKIEGLVDRPFSLSYDELRALPSVEAPVTLSCVSNGVGQNLVGNAMWRGVPLTALLERAGVQSTATQLASFSVDGWSCGFPTEIVTPDRTVLVAYEMNGEPLPTEHGFPARLVTAGLYGYVSATKWLNKIELTTWEDFQGYWIPRGWSRRGPVKLQSRIDVPRQGTKVSAGPVGVGGVAWSPTVGIKAVEVKIDQGPWQPAQLGAVASDETWAQWRFDWNATLGTHSLEVRATDGAAMVQTAERSPVEPSGATGHHIIRLEVI